MQTSVSCVTIRPRGWGPEEVVLWWLSHCPCHILPLRCFFSCSVFVSVTDSYSALPPAPTPAPSLCFFQFLSFSISLGVSHPQYHPSSPSRAQLLGTPPKCHLLSHPHLLYPSHPFPGAPYLRPLPRSLPASFGLQVCISVLTELREHREFQVFPLLPWPSGLVMRFVGQRHDLLISLIASRTVPGA